MSKLLRFFFILFLVAGIMASCSTIDLYEKNIIVPGYKWASSFKPVFSFTIKDTASLYDIKLVLRHNEKYNYNNIWVQVHYQAPGDSVKKISRELVLADNESGWKKTGSGMDDIWEHRLSLTGNNPIPFSKPGIYTFTLEHIMREDPLENIMNVGLRVEKIKN